MSGNVPDRKMGLLIAQCRRIPELLTLFIIGVSLVVSACSKEEPEQAPVARPIKMLTVGNASTGGVREYPGKITAEQHADMAFEVHGKLIDFPVKEGQEVSKGTVLARLDPRDFRANRDAARARRNAAKADYERYRDLYERDAASRQDLDVARRNYEVEQANLRTAQKALEDATLKAPFAGVVAKKLVDDPPVNVQAKQAVLVLQDDSSLKIVVNIPERDMAQATPGLSLEERAARSKSTVIVSSFPDRRFPAKLREFATTADPTTRTFEVTLAFENPPDISIAPGMTAKVVVTVSPDKGQSSPVVMIPANAVLSDDTGKAFVWRVDPASMQVQRAPVELGELSGAQTEIRSGLANGDMIAISGVHQLRDEMPVRRLD